MRNKYNNINTTQLDDHNFLFKKSNLTWHRKINEEHTFPLETY